jgi:hypothetical protein
MKPVFDKEAETVRIAVQALGAESDPDLLRALEEEQSAAATGLEYYGITKTVFERLLERRDLKPSTRTALKKAIKAVVKMYTQ